MARATSVEEYIEQAGQWQIELGLLRKILLSCDLQQTIKWGGPCYTLNGKNLVGLGSFKSYVGLWFHQGALLADKHQVLVNAQQGRTRAISAMRSETPRKRLAWRRYCR